MSEIISYCRQCEGFCGVVATVKDGGITHIQGDRNNPLSAGFLCPSGHASAAAPTSERRIRRPRKRDGDRWVEISWDTAIREIGERLSRIRSSAGARAVAISAGDPVLRSSKDVVRTAAFALATGTPNLFTALAEQTSPFLYATEQVLGHPVPLQSDVGRATYSILMGGNQTAGPWGPLMGGTIHTQALNHMKKTLEAELAVADPRRTPLAEASDVHLNILPGTDLFLLLGLVNTVASSKYWDSQYVGDYCSGFEELRDAVAPWTTERTARICGIKTGQISGVALKFARSPMGTIQPGRGMMQSPNATLSSWALLALHALTANLLRPGGMYSHGGMLDLTPIAQALPTASAPRSRVSDRPSMMLQLPASLLAEEIRTPGDGQVKALICLHSDPARSGGHDAERSLEELDLLAVADAFESATSTHADYVLPLAHFWEREDAHLHDAAILPAHFSQVAKPLLPASQDTWTVEHFLSELFRATKPPSSGAAWGRHLVAGGKWLAGADLGKWEGRVWDLMADTPMAQIAASPSGLLVREIDRTRWDVSTDDNRMALAPRGILEALSRLTEPAANADFPLVLGSRSRTDREPLPSGDHPAEEMRVELSAAAAEALQLSDGDAVVVGSATGELGGRLAIDPDLRDGAAIVPYLWGPAADAGGIPAHGLAPRAQDPFTGVSGIAGTPVSVRKA